MGITTRSISVQGHDLTYDQRNGEGPTIVLVHGITTYRFIWRNLIPLFPSGYNVIALDLLGCGDSDKPLDVDYSLNHHAHLLSEFIHALDIKKFHLLGHDVGGGIGQIFAVNHGDRLESLTLLNSVGYHYWPVQPILTLRTPVIRQLAMAALDISMFKLIVRKGVFHKDRVNAELMAYFQHPLKTSEGRKAFLHFAKCLNNHDLVEIDAALHRLKIPTLIIRGNSDPYLGAEISIRLNETIPASELVTMNDAGHFIQEDVPQAIVDTMVKYFRL